MKGLSKKARQKRKQELVYIMGGKCSLCGYDRCIAALEFHHIDKSQKERQLSSGSCHSWEEDVKEVKEGYDCGITIEHFNDVKVGDRLECFVMEETERE